MGPSFCSALVLGVYDLLKKLAVRNNAVPPVLFFGALTGMLVWCALRLITPWLPTAWQAGLAIDPLTWREHAFLFGTGALVSASWIFGYFALKHLPITIAGPVRSSAPLGEACHCRRHGRVPVRRSPLAGRTNHGESDD